MSKYINLIKDIILSGLSFKEKEQMTTEALNIAKNFSFSAIQYGYIITKYPHRIHDIEMLTIKKNVIKIVLDSISDKEASLEMKTIIISYIWEQLVTEGANNFLKENT